MDLPQNNLLLRLHKWAVRQDENFLTDVFAHLLQHLLENEPEAAVGLLGSLTGGFFKVRADQAKSVAMRTQVVLSDGTPDLEIRFGDQLAFVEVKSESEADVDQLRRYRRMLKESVIPATCLVLLTRYPASIAEEDAAPDAYARWYQIAEWMEHQRSRYTFKAVSAFLVEQFLSFLGARKMTMSQVTWALSEGVRALNSLTDMLYEAAEACGVAAQPWGSRTSMGVRLDKRNYWVGIRFDHPEFLVFATDYRKVSKDAAARLGKGEVFEWTSEPGYGWRHKLNLESEDVHFFARSKASQMQVLESFLKDCLDSVKCVEIPGARIGPATDASAEGDEPRTTVK